MKRKQTIKTNFVILGLLLVLAGGLFVVATATAQTPLSIEPIGASIGLGTADLKSVIINIIRWLLGILALVAVSFILYGGYMWLTSAGNTERIQKAKRVILNAVIGLVIVLLAWAIVFFVAKSILGSSGGTTPCDPAIDPSCAPCDPLNDPTCILPDIGFKVTAITTDCPDPTATQNNVYLCSSVSLTFNHLVNPDSVSSAVGDPNPSRRLRIEQFDALGALAVPQGQAVDGQAFKADTPSDPQIVPEWVAKKTPGPAKTVTLYHHHALFEPSTDYTVTIPKSITDTGGKQLSQCLDGISCVPAGLAFTWSMKTGTEVDKIPPKVTSTYPDSRYISTPAYDPDRSVPRTPIISINFDQAIDNNIKQDNPNALDNTVALRPYDPNFPPNPSDGSGGTLLATSVDPNKFTVVMGPDGRSLVVQMKAGNLLEKFTWYKVVVKNIRDLCNNLQSPDPYEWVFETNDVVPGISQHYPVNGTANACPDTPAFIQYTVSMYDTANSSCGVHPNAGGYVTSGKIVEDITPFNSRTLAVDPSNDCSPPGCTDYQNRCKLYSFMPNPPVPTAKQFNPNKFYHVGVDNRFKINDSGGTLRFGDTFAPPPPKLGDWHFTTKPPGECVNKPVITAINPPQGTEGQCLTISGYNLDPKNDQRLGGDDLLFDGTGGEPSLSWTDNTIVTKVRTAPAVAVGTHKYSAKVDFGAPTGTVDSLPPGGKDWERINGPASNGPCLISLEPNSGFRGSDFTARGKLFNANSTVKKVIFNASPLPSFMRWTEEEITGNKVPSNAALIPNEVRIENDDGISNPLPFTVNPIPPDRPYVIDRWPSCAGSCINAGIGAQFSIDIDETTLSNAAVLKVCTSQQCTAFGGEDILTLNNYDAATRKAEFNPPGLMALNAWYRVVLKDTVTATSGGKLAGLNYDDNNNGQPDSYSWTFRTSGPGGGCTLGRVEVRPASAMMTQRNQTANYYADAFTDANSCSAQGQPMNSALLTWQWLSNSSYATVNPSNAANTVVTAVEETVGRLPGDVTPITAQATDGSIQKSDSGQLTIDFSRCEDNTDCVRGGACPGSTCDQVTHRCSPVIKSIAPAAGAIGTWVGIHGCYFGSYAQGKCKGEPLKSCHTNRDCTTKSCLGGSRVTYTDNKRGVWPDPNLCGSPKWSDTDIVSEVPDRTDATLSAEFGVHPLVVQRSDGVTSNGKNFDVNNDKIPGICSIIPGGGPELTPVTIKGQNFGEVGNEQRRIRGDKVTFYNGSPSGADVTNYTSWTDSQIMCKAPTGIKNNSDPSFSIDGRQWNEKEVAVKQSGNWSNAVNFQVGPTACFVCSKNVPGQCSAGQACGSNGCCAQRPALVGAPAPAGSGICRNATISAQFDRAIDPNSVNSTNVVVLRTGPAPVKLTAIDDIQYLPQNLNPNCDFSGSDPNGKFLGSCINRNFITTSPVTFSGAPSVLSLNTSNNFSVVPYIVSQYDIHHDVEIYLDMNDSATLDGADLKLGTISNPAVRPQFTYTGYLAATPPAGRHRIILAWINDWTDPIRGSSFGDSNIVLYSLTLYNGGAFVPGNTRIDNGTAVTFVPAALLERNAQHEVRIRGADVRYGVTGVEGAPLLDAYTDAADRSETDRVWTFTTADAAGPCNLSRIEVTPSTWTFPKADPARPQSKKEFIAHAYSDTGVEISKLPGVYNWTWDWSIADTSLADFTPGNPGNVENANVQAKFKKGRTNLIAAAKPVEPAQGYTGSVAGSASLNVTACEKPWLQGAPYTFQDADNHFDIGYCMDGGLPNLSFDSGTSSYRFTITTSAPTEGNSHLLKEFLFKEIDPNTRDAIGIRVYDNIEVRSAQEWYNKFAPKPRATSPLLVDGYDAVRDGTTVYVAATDFNGTNFIPRIFLISYNQGADPKIQNIYNQMLANWFFNTNVTTNCNATESDKLCVQRDLRRIAAVTDINKLLRDYKKTRGFYPKLESGSFLKNMSFSVWPSWQQTLGGDVAKPLPVDPKNKIENCPAEQAQDGTCWNEAAKKFKCSDPQSRILGYATTSDGSGVGLFANLEYNGIGNWKNFSGDICSSPSTCACFNYELTLDSFTTPQAATREAQRKVDLSSIETALNAYNRDHGSYPIPGDGWDVGYRYPNGNGDAEWSELETMLSPYLSPLPRDPLSNSNQGRYMYYAEDVPGARIQGQGYTLIAYPTELPEPGCNFRFYDDNYPNKYICIHH